MEQTYVEQLDANERSFQNRMLYQFTSLSKDFLIYGMGGSLGHLLGLISISLLTRVLPVEEFGATDVIYAVIGYFSIVMSFNIGSGLFRYYYEVPENQPEERRRMVSSLFWFIVIVGGSIALLSSFFAPAISTALFHTTGYTLPVRLALLSLPLLSLYNLFIGLQRLRRRPQIYLLMQVGYALLYLILVIWLVGIRKIGITGIFIAQPVAQLICNLFGFWMERDLIWATFSYKWFSQMAIYAIPLLPASFLLWSLVALNRYFINAYSGPAQVGYYGLASKVSLAMSLVVTAFIQAWQPIMLSNIKNPDAPRLYSLILNYYLIGSLLLGACLTVFAREIFLILSPPEYLAGVGLLGLLIIRQILPAIDYIAGAGIVISKKTIYTPLSWGLGVLVNIAVNLLLTPRYGIYGAAIAEMSGFFVGVLAIAGFSYRLYPVRWNLNTPIQAIFGFSVVTAISLFLMQTDLGAVWVVLIKLSALILYFFFLLRFIDPMQRNILVSLPRQLAQQAWSILHTGATKNDG